MQKEKGVKTEISISGMHCRSCEILIEERLLEIPEVERAKVDHKKGIAEIYHGNQRPNMHEVENAIREAGYAIGFPGAKKTLFSRNPEDYKDLGIAFLFLAGIYVILNNLGLANINVGSASNPSSLGVVLLVGLTAGFSTCMALVGGLILGISARHSEKHPEATSAQKFRPHLFFNAGRIGGYALFGGVLGAAGSALELSGTSLGALTIIVGVVMLALGIKLMGIFPRMENIGIALPKGISKILGIKKHEKEYSHRGAAVTGALTFFLPCGFTQAMQLYAVSTGSFARGALIMGIFALGTAPGLLGVGGFTSIVKGIFARRFFRFSGILVAFLAFFNIANGYNLIGWQGLATDERPAINSSKGNDPNVKMENGMQVVRMTESSRGYSPNKFTIQKGVPVRWVIDAQDPYSCASSLMISKLGIRKNLKAGENVIEFTPTESGRLPFSCSMGMYTGAFSVVEDAAGSVAATQQSDLSETAGAGGTCSMAAGKGGCGAPAKRAVADQKQEAARAVNAGDKQLIKTAYTQEGDIVPAEFVVRAGQAVRLEIDAQDDGYGCMSTIMIPGLYNRPELLRGGERVVLEFTPSEKGEYPITCAMGMQRGTLKVE